MHSTLHIGQPCLDLPLVQLHPSAFVVPPTTTAMALRRPCGTQEAARSLIKSGLWGLGACV